MKAELRLMCAALLAIVLVVASCQNRSIAREKTMEGTTSIDGRQDFDFLAGDWEVANRRLKQRHSGSNEWDEFPARSSMRRILGGLGNVDEIHFPTKGWSGATFRFYNTESRLWSIFWVNSRDGLMTAPVVGAFRNGIGELYGDDMDGGRPIRVRYLWSMITGNTARWEQAFSTDGGSTWETNWIMELRRAPGETS